MSSLKQTSHRAIIVIIMLIIVLMVGVTDLHIPSLPAIKESLSASVRDVQLTITIYLLLVAISPLIYGPLSDAYGRKKILLVGLFIAFFGSLLCMLAPTIHILLLGRALQGLGLGAGSAMMRAVFRDVFTGKALAKAGSYLGSASSLTMGLAPILGGLIQDLLGWRFNFAVIVVGVVIGFVCVLWFFPETHHNRNHKAKNPLVWLKQYVHILSSKVFVLCVLLAGCAFSGLVVYAAIAPFLFQSTYGLTPFEFGLLAIFIAIAQAAGFNLNSKLLKKLSINQAILIGVTMMLISGFLLTFLSLMGWVNIAVIIAMVVIYIVGTGFIYANAYAQAFATFGHVIGFASAMYAMLQTGFGGLLSFAVALIPNDSALTMGVIFVILALFGLMLFLAIRKYKTDE